MISTDFVQQMAHYNRWQNGFFYRAANSLTDTERRQDCGVFFGSLHTTLAHILWADRVWMNRFAGTPATSPDEEQGRGASYADWTKLEQERQAFDEQILSWAGAVSDDWLKADFTWSNLAGTRTATLPAWKLVSHMFNHQTHHRGQAHALLTRFGLATEDTDLFLMPPSA